MNGAGGGRRGGTSDVAPRGLAHHLAAGPGLLKPHPTYGENAATMNRASNGHEPEWRPGRVLVDPPEFSGKRPRDGKLQEDYRARDDNRQAWRSANPEPHGQGRQRHQQHQRQAPPSQPHGRGGSDSRPRADRQEGVRILVAKGPAGGRDAGKRSQPTTRRSTARPRCSTLRCATVPTGSASHCTVAPTVPALRVQAMRCARALIMTPPPDGDTPSVRRDRRRTATRHEC